MDLSIFCNDKRFFLINRISSYTITENSDCLGMAVGSGEIRGDREVKNVKKSILISGKDYEYNRSMAAMMAEENRELYATAVLPEQLRRQRENLLSSFDILLLDEDMKNDFEDVGDRALFMTDKLSDDIKEKEWERTVFKYQSIRGIMTSIRNCINHENDYGRNIFSDEDSETSRKLKDTVIIGVLSNDDAACERVAVLLGRVFSASGKDTVCMDFRQINKSLEVIMTSIGKKNWNEFIYSCLYGKIKSVLSEPKTHASMDEWGVMYYEGTPGANPFHELEESEVELFLNRVRKCLHVEYAICLFPDYESIFASESKINLLIGDGFDFFVAVNSRKNEASETKNSKNGKGEKKEANGYKAISSGLLEMGFDAKRVISVNYGVIRDISEKDDFNIRCSNRILNMSIKETLETSAWKEMVKVAGYIKNW